MKEGKEGERREEVYEGRVGGREGRRKKGGRS